MPVYEYQCTNGHHFEVRQGFNDDPVQICQVCESPVRRVIHPVGIVFKGSGFYATDSRKSSSKSASSDAKSTSKSDSGGESASETKTDTSSKPDVKSDVKTATGGEATS